ncbi:HNH endonuclease [Niallia taxi]|nr:HNH endonuclease [Niallia taxi]MDE5052475.1 HNH endonuclease [Niallia taxi]
MTSNRSGISDINALGMLGGIKRYKEFKKILIYQLNNNEKVVIKYSKLYSNGTLYWFGVTPNAIELYKTNGISHIVFILGYEGIIKLPIKILYRYIKNANITLNKENGNIKRHHINIKFESKLTLYNSKEKYTLDDFYLYDENIVYSELNEKSNDIILKEAKKFKDYSSNYYEKVTKSRKESRAQKERIAILEDHTCQVCGYKEGFQRTNRRKIWIIEVDHIIEKSNGGGETIDNLWVLCPNCHAKKTKGVITIDPSLRIVKENGKEIKIRDNHLGWN